MKHIFLFLISQLFCQNKYKIIKKNTEIKDNTKFVLYFYGFGDKCRDVSPFEVNKNEYIVICIEYFVYGSFDYFSKGRIFDNIEESLENIKKDLKLNKSYYTIIYGSSLGGLASRAYFSEHENKIFNIKKFITIGTPNMGYTKIINSKIATLALKTVSVVFINFLNKIIVDQNNILEEYFIRDLNHLEGISEKYPNSKKFFTNLDLFVSISFQKDQIIEPKTSPFFEYYNGEKLIKYDDKDHILFQKDDKLGLNELKNKNKIVFILVDGTHLRLDHFSYEYLDKVIENYTYEDFSIERNLFYKPTSKRLLKSKKKLF